MDVWKDIINSSKRDDWRTPKELFNSLNDEFVFTLDAAASDDNALCSKYFTVDDDGLKQDWTHNTVWCNPPYGRGKTKAWVKKAYEEVQKGDCRVVMLIPSRTGTSYFHDYILGKAEIRFILGRLHFDDCGGNAPFDSMIAVFG